MDTKPVLRNNLLLRVCVDGGEVVEMLSERLSQASASLLAFQLAHRFCSLRPVGGSWFRANRLILDVWVPGIRKSCAYAIVKLNPTVWRLLYVKLETNVWKKVQAEGLNDLGCHKQQGRAAGRPANLSTLSVWKPPPPFQHTNTRRKSETEGESSEGNGGHIPSTVFIIQMILQRATPWRSG